MLCDCIMNALDKDRLAQCRAGHILVNWHQRGRKVDKDCVYANAKILSSIIVAAESCYVDKAVLTQALQQVEP